MKTLFDYLADFYPEEVNLGFWRCMPQRGISNMAICQVDDACQSGRFAHEFESCTA